MTLCRVFLIAATFLKSNSLRCCPTLAMLETYPRASFEVYVRKSCYPCRCMLTMIDVKLSRSLFTLFFQAKSTTKAAKSSRGHVVVRGHVVADKDLAAALKLERVIPSSSSSSHSHLSLLARPPAKNFSCAICNMQFVRQDSWGSHMRQHERAADPVSNYIQTCRCDLIRSRKRFRERAHN